ncbi:molybdenum cofactor biosynthesis protein [Halobacillus halophilus]|uniref:Molybdenum cofactor biosynthesis protein B n=1 Tax=Halobacillus halophilus (strain ATCC 35676 / DSM 2266 / JCM 20832 / KCTC 3685 / LMG 17431 / NBRC 102448 / NCIMB 2269) TaxID=866895 RepID=I0JPR1_HALH3|nr:molybdenum cofactor biosynthesis protein B [Halobacillus halophilus]ASF40160.1 molybdenum cofactor biosynthesis protein [Halobacillus halophilus]CCG46131.1 molybdenum cofactor biosynthesis protein MoaB [Halobacillus halophilus DSM 2266]
MAVEDHKREAPSSVRCMVLTISDTRNIDTDKSGKIIIEKLTEKSQHRVNEYKIVKDDQKRIAEAVKLGLTDPDIDVVLLNGGTGIAERDVTIEAVQALITKEIPGFGELFRMLSYNEDIGSAALLSRATAGVSEKTAIFSMPGSSGAVKLAMDRLILPEISHVVREINKEE